MPRNERPPILDREQFDATLEYIADKAHSLGVSVLRRDFEIDTLTIFARTAEELGFVQGIVLSQGPQSHFSHGDTIYVEPEELIIGGHNISLLGVRNVIDDKKRSEVGYADFPVDNFSELLDAASTNPFLEVITSGRGQFLVEFRHHDFNVLAYAFDRADH
jgi:hypothetical protein